MRCFNGDFIEKMRQRLAEMITYRFGHKQKTNAIQTLLELEFLMLPAGLWRGYRQTHVMIRLPAAPFS